MGCQNSTKKSKSPSKLKIEKPIVKDYKSKVNTTLSKSSLPSLNQSKTKARLPPAPKSKSKPKYKPRPQKSYAKPISFQKYNSKARSNLKPKPKRPVYSKSKLKKGAYSKPSSSSTSHNYYVKSSYNYSSPSNLIDHAPTLIPTAHNMFAGHDLGGCATGGGIDIGGIASGACDIGGAISGGV